MCVCVCTCVFLRVKARVILLGSAYTTLLVEDIIKKALIQASDLAGFLCNLLFLPTQNCNTLCVCMCVYVCVWFCLCVHDCVYVCVCVIVCVCVSVCV